MRIVGLVLLSVVVFVAVAFILAAGLGVPSSPGFFITTVITIMAFIVAVAADARGKNPVLWMIHGALLEGRSPSSMCW